MNLVPYYPVPGWPRVLDGAIKEVCRIMAVPASCLSETLFLRSDLVERGKIYRVGKNVYYNMAPQEVNWLVNGVKPEIALDTDFRPC